METQDPSSFDELLEEKNESLARDYYKKTTRRYGRVFLLLLSINFLLFTLVLHKPVSQCFFVFS